MSGPRRPEEGLPRKSALPAVWLALTSVALALLAAAWNYLQ